MGERLKDKVAMVTGAGSVGPGWGNGKAAAVAFDGLVSPSVETLLDWAGRDQDRTMLYAAELTLEPVR